MPAGSLPTQAPGGRFTCNGIALSGQARNVPARRIEDWECNNGFSTPLCSVSQGRIVWHSLSAPR